MCNVLRIETLHVLAQRHEQRVASLGCPAHQRKKPDEERARMAHVLPKSVAPFGVGSGCGLLRERDELRMRARRDREGEVGEGNVHAHARKQMPTRGRRAVNIIPLA